MSETETFAIATFVARWHSNVPHDLSGSDSETLSLSELLELAEPDDVARWSQLGFGYCDPRGAPWLRTAIARRYGGIGSDEVLCCAGAQEAITCVTASLLEPDDHAIVVLPIYQPSEQAVTRVCRTTGVPLEPDRWTLDLDRLAAAIEPTTKLVLANFPNSPTGATLDADMLRGLVTLCRRHGLWLVNDEIYRQTDDSPDHARIPATADAYERGISINGLSKGFGLPGLRVGWAACRDRELMVRALNTKSTLSSCLSSPSEVLAHVALRAEGRIVERSRAIGRENHRRFSNLAIRYPDTFDVGAGNNLAFCFPRYVGPGSVDLFADRLARQAGLLVLPSTLWRSTLAPVPVDHLRIGLGHARGARGLDALDSHMSMRNVA